MNLSFNQPIRQAVSATLDEYINSCQLMSQALGISQVLLDKENQIVFASPAFAQQFNFRIEELIGENFNHKMAGIFSSSGIKQLDIVHAQIITKNHRRIYLEVCKKNTLVETHISHKAPVFDQKGELLCLHIQYKPFTIARLANLGAKFHKLEGYYPLNRDGFAQVELSRVQQMIIYLYVRNYSYTEIAAWITRFSHQISPTAVNKQLLKLKTIFNVDSSDALKDVSFKYGYDVAVPVEFLPEGIHDITEDAFDLWLC